MDEMAKTGDILKDKESLQVVMVGTGTPFSLDRSMTGVGVIANGHFFMFDAGPGVVQQLELQKLPINKIDGVFLTHYHSDHYLDLPNLINRSWSQGNENAINVYGPDGLPGVINGLNQFLAIENHYRVKHHGALLDMEKSIAIPNEFQLGEDKTKLVYDNDGIKITAFKVNHDPVHSAVGYVVEYNGKKLVMSGDTKKNAMVEKMAKDADMLIHEVMLMSFIEDLEKVATQRDDERTAQMMRDIRDYHTSPSEVAEVAQNAQAKKLILSHVAPPADNVVMKKAYKDKMKAYKGPIEFAEDGDIYIVE